MILWRPTRSSRTDIQKWCPFYHKGLECKSRKSRNTWSNRQIWPWSTEWSRGMADRVLPRELTSHSKHPLPTKQEKTLHMNITRFSSVQFSHSVMSDSLQPHELQHARPLCPSATPGVYPNPSPLSQWCRPTISFSVIPFSSCPQFFPASGSFRSQLFVSGGQSIGVSASASVLPMHIQDWFLLGWNGWISLQSKGLSRVFSNTTVQKHQFFGAQLSL